jgi:hypothetical protein
LDPLPFTWRELDEMDFGRASEEWERLSSLMATVVNCQRTKNPVKPDQLNPMKKLARRRKPRREISPLLRYL